MSKVRVYEVARELGLENRELIQRIAALGIQVRNHMSVLETAEVDQVKRALEKERVGDLVETKIRPTVTRRRVRKKAKPAVEPEVIAAEPDPAPPVVASEPRPAERPPPMAEPTPEPVVEAAPPAVVEAAAAPEVVEATPPAAAAAPAAEAEVVEAAPAPAVVATEAAPVEATAEAAAPEASEPAVVEAKPEPEVRTPKVIHFERQVISTLVEPSAEPRQKVDPSADPAPIAERFGHAPLPPGVTKRGNTAAPSAGARLSEEERQRIVAEHAAQRPTTRRREIRGRASIGAATRPHGRGKRRKEPGKKPRQTVITVPSAAKRKIRIEDQIALQMLAQRMSLKATDLLMKLMQMGVGGVHINSTLDAETAIIIADEFGYEVENVARSEDEVVGDARGDFENLEEDRRTRAPIVTIMGHVDHGKTSLLDKIRTENVASGEAGGITQHISAFRVTTKKGDIVFLDTPGHEAFTAMRQRGAQATDVVVLVTAADDGVMPQTREAVSHSQAAGVPIIVAVNKMDKDGANPEKVKNELAALGLQPEEWGGETLFVPTSAITGSGLDSLLDAILLTSEVLELQANDAIPAEGIVLEAKVDRGRGVVANVLVRDGTLKPGDFVVAGATWGRVKAMTDDRGKVIKVAGPATPIELLGLAALPSAGDRIFKVTDAKKAQEVAGVSAAHAKGTQTVTAPRGLDQFQQFLQSGEQEELQLVVKADVQGSIEALKKSLEDLSTEKVRVKIIHTGVGGITENDVMLAGASNGIIIGFNVRPQGKAGSVAKKSGVEIRSYSVIYEALGDVRLAMAGLLAPDLVNKEVGAAEVRETFGIPKLGTIAGCMVTNGKILRNGKARLVRDGIVVWTGEMGSLRRFKDSVADVSNGFECGIGLEAYNDVKVGDIIECFEVEEVAATL